MIDVKTTVNRQPGCRRRLVEQIAPSTTARMATRGKQSSWFRREKLVEQERLPRDFGHFARFPEFVFFTYFLFFENSVHQIDFSVASSFRYFII